MHCYSFCWQIFLWSIVLPDCAWTSCNILALWVEMNTFECSLYLHISFRTQSLMFWHCTRCKLFKFKTRLLNISDQHLIKIKNYSVHNTFRISLLDLLEYKRPPCQEDLQGLQTFATTNSRMFPKQVSV